MVHRLDDSKRAASREGDRALHGMVDHGRTATRQELGNVALAPSQAKPNQLRPDMVVERDKNRPGLMRETSKHHGLASAPKVQMAGFSAFTHFSPRPRAPSRITGIGNPADWTDSDPRLRGSLFSCHVTLYTGRGSSAAPSRCLLGRGERGLDLLDRRSRHLDTLLASSVPCSAVADPRRPFPWADLG
ncbi:hypothetical protein CH63R_00917 [Colletotrichum higginsianum IMI 349063]|uniref:Uncharacterized protein n=1 Tax=Colletotrichum higginsianum (strain IMI 349063) TaxID=759273 RepID=A0A1B7YUM6_COLHI|nr:hypothetical protein CH63R_00917 [Colletotrichum higginsianum IMI 349063]OBR15737.1 hypothetical protein CH63R_00917 [Colletotrichum higginsianum IMI 349063]